MARAYSDLTVGSGDLRQAVKLPEGEGLSKWLAVHAVDQINTPYGTLSEDCTPERCPIVSSGKAYQWADGVQFRKAMRATVSEYVDYLTAWVQSQLDDETLFPSSNTRCHAPTASACHASRPGAATQLPAPTPVRGGEARERREPQHARTAAAARMAHAEHARARARVAPRKGARHARRRRRAADADADSAHAVAHEPRRHRRARRAARGRPVASSSPVRPTRRIVRAHHLGR